MSNVKIQAPLSGTGTVTITAPTTNSDRTVTLPDENGTLILTGGALGTPSSGNGSNLTNLNASNLASGTVPDARFPATLPAASGVNLTALNASNLGSGTVPDARFPATLPAVSGANLTSLNASNLSSGTVATARLASGTANSTTFLRGDQTWATAGGAPAALGDIGTVMWATINTTSNLFPGNTVAGSSCYYPTAFSAVVNSNTTFTEGTNNSNPRTEYRVNQNVGTGVATTVRTQSGNTGYQFSTTNLAALSGTWRVLLPMVARSSAYNGEDVSTESVTRGTLIQRIS
jgi:hypothetical protein